MDIQETGTFVKCSFSRRHYFEIWVSEKSSDRKKRALETFTGYLKDIENIDITPLSHRLVNLCKSLDKFWKKTKCTKSVFLNKHSDWLDIIECIELKRSVAQCVQVTENLPGPSHGGGISSGRPKKDFSELSKRSKRRRLAELSNVDSSTVNALLDTSDQSNTSSAMTISADEALSLIVEAKLTKHQYLLIKELVNSKTSCNILPSYQNVLNAKKDCYPKNISVSETTGEVELQSLLDHTVSRIVESQSDVLKSVPNDSLNNLVLIGKWGFDGSTGHSEYKQSFSDSTKDDSSLFVTSYVPLQLISKTDSESSCDSKILWKNPRPCSTRYCRPIRFQYLKETSEVSKEEEAYFKGKISRLQPTSITVNGRDINIEHSLQLTMVDGKICSALCEFSSSRCYICGASPKEMNKIDDCLRKPVQESHYEFGLSPLHAWIRFFEYFIHLSYRIDIKKWQVRSDVEKSTLAERKKCVQNEFRSKLGLVVDKPRSGGSGTSNDGNTARKFFSNSAISAEITGLKKDLLDRCYVILQALSSGYNIDAEKFRVYSLETARQLVQEYPWYNLPASVHKILVHGSDISEHALLSIGELSEEAAESNNKNLKTFRRDHTRKFTREITNTDLLNRLLLCSDPFITGLRKLPRKKKGLLRKEVLDLLKV